MDFGVQVAGLGVRPAGHKALVGMTGSVGVQV